VSAQVYFPMIHGFLGEDGKIQTLLELAQVPFVGCAADAAAVTMNKDFTKRVLSQCGVAVAEWETVYAVTSKDERLHVLERAVQRLGLPLFVKPASQGSSVGVRKVNDKSSLEKAVGEALAIDRMVIVEKAIKGRELEVSVLGDRELVASLPGEIHVQKDEFYTYDAKYVHPERVSFSIPAKLEPTTSHKMQDMAKRACRYLGVQGLARVDFLLDEVSQQPYVSEINTLPGFTPISMYPKMLAQSGFTYTEVLDRLVDLARSTFEDRALRMRSALGWRPT
jgi:D-alanine-D-alanine ligase